MALFVLTMGASSCQNSAEERVRLDVELVPEGALGLLEGPEESVFGNIRQVRAASDGSFFVLDGQGGTVRWYSQDMVPLGGITARGSGPGELGRPLAIDVTPAGRLGVLDPANGRIAAYRATPSGLQYENATGQVVLSPYAYNERNLCGTEDRWYLHQQDEGRVIREYEVNGAKLATLEPAVRLSAQEYGVMAQVAEIVMNSGMLLCLVDRSLVVSAGLRSNIVRAYSTVDGSLVWEVSLPGVDPEPYELEPAPGIAGGFPLESDGAHVGVSLVRWSDESLIVQYRYWAGDRREPEVTRIESIQLAIADGGELARSDELPVVADVWRDLVYTFENEPYPQVLVFRRELGS